MCVAFLRPHLVNPVPSGIQHAHITGLQGSDETETLVPQTFWIHKRACDGKVILHYKHLSADEVWYPPISMHAKVLETDPNGIELFSTPPPDPMVTPPDEVQLKSVALDAADGREPRCMCAMCTAGGAVPS